MEPKKIVLIKKNIKKITKKWSRQPRRVLMASGEHVSGSFEWKEEKEEEKEEEEEEKEEEGNFI